ITHIHYFDMDTNGTMDPNLGVEGPTNPMVSPLLTDLYQFTMAYAYWKAGKQLDKAVFDLFFRKNPFGGEYTVFAGLEECIRFAANFKFKEEDVEFLRTILPNTCEEGFFDYLRGLNCLDIEIYAIPEGSVVFPKIPLIRIEGPVAVAQLLETTFLNLVNYASLVATNAARHRRVAGDSKVLLEFGLRRAQGKSPNSNGEESSHSGERNSTQPPPKFFKGIFLPKENNSGVPSIRNYVVDIGDIDLVLGVQWLHSLGDFTQNNKTMEMKITKDGKEIILLKA
ncbi:hypothetical protein KI387_031394, partial [Taxus chinensis]